MTIPFDKLDLNLLRVFDVAMEERSVSRAARRLGITQSSTSNALDRLRRALDDRVLERSGNAMVPTRAAVELWPHVRSALAQIATGLDSIGAFDPAAMRQTIGIGMDEYSLAVLGPAIEARLRAAAPKVRVAFLPGTPDESEDDLFAGRLDLLIGPVWRATPGLERVVLLGETFVGVADAGHPMFVTRADGMVSVEDYVRYPHILVSRRGIVSGNVDAGLRRLGLRRKIVTATPYFVSAPGFVRDTELILNLGRRLARQLAGPAGLRTFTLPVDVPGFEIGMIWHPRNTEARSHRWLRGEIAAVAAGMGA
jgi:LysR family transcriptional regulator, mexEF-oprN operon transcriptional activator